MLRKMGEGILTCKHAMPMQEYGYKVARAAKMQLEDYESASLALKEMLSK